MTREEAISNLKKLVGFSPKYDEAISTLFPDKQHLLPGTESEADRIAGKDFIPVEWGEACDAYGKWKIVRVEPIPSDVEEAAMEYIRPKLSKDYVEYGERKQMQLTRFDGYDILEAIEFGAEYERGKYELVYEANGAIPDDRGGYWPTDVKLYRRKEEKK